MPASASANPAAARAQASKAKLNPLWWQYACATILAALVVGNALRWLFLDGADPYKCGGLMTQGAWMDPGTHKQWQPEGCFHTKLNHHAYFQCLSTGTSNTPVRLSPPSKRVVTFIGDSTVRQLFYGLVRLVDGGKNVAPRDWANEGEKHSDKRVTFYEGAGTSHERAVELEFLWDPYLNTTKTTGLLHSTSLTPDPSAMLVIGSGLWYLRNPGSGGLSAWTEMIESTFDALKIAQGSPSSPLQNPWDTLNARSNSFGMLPSHAGAALNGPAKRQLLKPSSIPFALSDSVIFLPVVDAIQSRLSPSRAETIQHTDIEAMNADLSARLAHPDPPPIVIPTVFNEMLPEEETSDGLHFSDKIMDQQAQILLGWRCNDVLKDEGLSSQGSCCRRYRWVRPVQGLLVLALAVWAPVGLVLGSRIAPSSPLASYLPPSKLATPLATFGLAVVYLFFADRSTLMYLENKVYDAKVVGALMGGFLLLGLATVKNAGKDGGFLGRDVTDEWKGWMQIAILIYHFFGASKISGIYNPIRVMVAAYLFMTGYGHFFFYYKKADFGFLRVCSVLVRLNLLSVVLPYTMNTDYAFYYFAPLVSWWYLIIYGTMAIGSKYNQTTFFLLPKLVLAAGLVTAFMHFPILLESIFSVLRTVFRIQWSASEWSFRVSLDLFVVWSGMFSAFAYIKIKEHGIPEKPFFPALRTAAIALAGFGIIWFTWFELRHDKFSYNGYHPYVSSIPVLSFVILRNATPLLRSSTSHLFQFIGQCSLETFVLQFHGWLASDTKAILLVLPATRWRTLNIVLSTAAFVWLSHVVARATGELTDYIVKGSKKNAGLPKPATASGPPAALADVKVDGVKGDIPLNTISEKQGESETKEEERLLAEEMGATPAASEEQRRGSWPSWMASTAATFSSRKSMHAVNKPGHSSSGVAGFFAKMGALAEEYLAAKMLMILGGLWALNWLY